MTWRDVGEMISVFVIVILIIGVFAGLCGGTNALLDNLACRELGRLNTDHEFQWGVWTGCRVQTASGLWIDADNMHLVEGALQ